jgi:hypothetical protein
MLSGFAAYRALEGAGVMAAEAYPDLQFRLWKDGGVLLPKSRGRAAFDQRKTIAQAIAAQLQIQGAGHIATMDEADAAILALSARAALNHGAIGLIEEPYEGRFAAALQPAQARRVGLMATGEVLRPQSLIRGMKLSCAVLASPIDAPRLR